MGGLGILDPKHQAKVVLAKLLVKGFSLGPKPGKHLM
jgi:hypothetical protein